MQGDIQVTNDTLNKKMLDSFCKEYQSVWLINLHDLTQQLFFSNMVKSIPNSIDTAMDMKSYELTRRWYVDNYVVECQKERVFQQTDINNILERTQNGEPFFVEYAREFGEQINYNQLCYDRITDDDGKVRYVIMAFRDIDVRKKSEIDDLTGLYTRQVFFFKAEELLRNNPDEKFDIVISDIVDFKEINENYGVEAGDAILRWVGHFLSPMISSTFLVGRYGGDRMVLIGTHDEVSYCMSSVGIEYYQQEEAANGLPSIVTKYGIYENIRHDKTIISSCDKALIALNRIKGHYEKLIGYYDDELIVELEKQRRIENSMHESLRNGDFKVYYQPKHDVVTGKLVGAEALIRWIHPEYGFMSPADFIPLFERNGFIVENDRYVWKKTCENLKKWKEKGIKTVPISINASKLTIEREDLIFSLQKPVDENGISPTQLHIEITETLMSNDIDELVDKLTQLRDIGYQIELDDFGAGYSSINILSTLPLDIVKLDMSFMKQFGDEKRAKVLASCINLAKELGYGTVSEGVELVEQREELQKLGVDYIQGYLFSKPLPEDEFEKYMIDNQ